jgi:hypothetical protein
MSVLSSHGFIPRGYMGIEPGLVAFASIRNPDRWKPEGLHAKEREIYEGLGRSHLSQFLSELLLFHIPAEERKANPEILERMLDYDEAIDHLREALHAGEIVAQFVDDRGKLEAIKREGWGTDAGLEILLCGTAQLEDGTNALRTVLLPLKNIEALARQQKSQSAAAARSGNQKIDKGGRPPEYDWGAIKAYALALIEQRGRPHKTNRLLQSNTELVEAIMNEWALEKDIHLSLPTVRKRVNLWLAEL